VRDADRRGEVAGGRRSCLALKVDAVAVCLLHASQSRPTTPRRRGGARHGRVAVTASSDVLPVCANMNAPRDHPQRAGRHGVALCAAHSARLEDAGHRRAAPVMQEWRRRWRRHIRRAPALKFCRGLRGVRGAADVAAACGFSHHTVDLGGTAPTRLIKGGQTASTQTARSGDWPLPMTMVDMVDDRRWWRVDRERRRRTLSVGPLSAGAIPVR